METNKQYNLKESIQFAADAIVSKTLLKQSGGTLTLFAFDAGQELSEHTAPFEAFVQILEGSAEVRISNITHALSQGDFLILPAGVPHAVKSITAFKMMLVMIKEQKKP